MVLQAEESSLSLSTAGSSGSVASRELPVQQLFAVLSATSASFEFWYLQEYGEQLLYHLHLHNAGRFVLVP